MSTAQQRLKEIAAQEQALADEKKKLLDASKEEDLKTVRELCKQHGFTATGHQHRLHHARQPVGERVLREL